ncbi:MAG: fasciclin domain-containing protein [Bacteroidaceae bacterium]|nr:fasciclin domain-containing protein [Bacteroidaceae bacterium]
MKYLNKYIGAVLMGGAMLTIPGCSDTWDDHYNAAEKGSSAATETLWEIISNNPNLSRFKAIAEKSAYYRDETHPQDGYTFKDMLQNASLMTVWAPENEAFSDEEYEHWLELAETNGYTVQQQLLGNSMALWRRIATGGGIDTVTMLNNKKLAFDKEKFTMNNIPLDKKNVAASNGTLHTVKEVLPFKFNFYEYLKDKTNAEENHLMKFHDLIVSNDTTYFSKDASIEGTPDANGNPTYVDSVYFTTNNLFFGSHRIPTEIPNAIDSVMTYNESFGEHIDWEDSVYVMVLPTDEAWEATTKKLEKYYNYANVYLNKKDENMGKNNQTLILSADTIDKFRTKNIDMDIISPLVFNLHEQPNAGGEKGRWQLEDFIKEKGASAEYFLNTFGDTLRTDAHWDKTSLFNGKQVELSNGVGLLSNEWNFPAKLYKPDLYIEVGTRSIFNYDQMNVRPEFITFPNSEAGEWVKELGKVSYDNFYYWFTSTNTTIPKVEFALVGTDGENRDSEVMSGKYEIQVVMVPDFYVYSVKSDTVAVEIGRSHKIVNGDTIPVKHKLQFTLTYCSNSTDSKGIAKETKALSEVIDWDGQKIDTLTIRFPELDGKNTTASYKGPYYDDVVFPYSYKNLRFCYPTLTIQPVKLNNTDIDKNGYSYNFCIDRIILRSKED